MAETAGCVVNTLQQVTSEPARMSVAISKKQLYGGADRAVGILCRSGADAGRRHPSYWQLRL